MGKGKKKERSSRPSTGLSKPAKLLLVLSAAIAVAAVVYALLVATLFAPRTVVELRVDEAEQLKDVLFGGQPWLVQCNETALGVKSRRKENRLVYQVADELPASFQSGLLNCQDKLPASGRTVVDKFKVNPYQTPAIFLAVNGGPIQQAPVKAIKNATTLVEWAKKAAVPRFIELRSTADISSQCLKMRKSCVVLAASEMLPGQRRNVGELMRQFRTSQFAFINTTRSTVDVPAPMGETVPGVFVLTRVDPAKTDKGDVLPKAYSSASGAKQVVFAHTLPEGSADAPGAIASLVSAALDKPDAGSAIGRMPDVVRKEKKKPKKAKKKSPKKAKTTSSTPPPPPPPAAVEDDGMTEEERRREQADREARRREEMEAANQDLFFAEDDDDVVDMEDFEDEEVIEL